MTRQATMPYTENMEHTEWQKYIASKGQMALQKKLGTKKGLKAHMRELAYNMHRKYGHKIKDKMPVDKPS